ncbi:hypothetical protein TWF506_004572 [Arthrobotrys conoides]|uniref:Uncharacterized protein n=1 Tax=Arthrobotrys conoides TaxID=74498 RepID=A0AAN8N9L3_9PEZI
MNSTIPILPELLFQTLGYCDIKTIWNFASTSRESYLLAFRVLALEYQFPLTVPYAMRSGLVEKHKDSRFYDRMDTVAIDITENTWDPSSLPHLQNFLKSKRETNASANVILYSQQNESCSINALVTVFNDIFVEFYDTIKGFSIRVEIAQMDELIFRNRMTGFYNTVRTGMSPCKAARGIQGQEALPLKSLDLRVKAYSARSMMELFINAVYHVMSVAGGEEGNRLEDIKIIVKWKVCGADEGSLLTPLMLGKLASSSVRKVWIEDKTRCRIENRVAECVTSWPNIEELHLDCGIAGSLSDYNRLQQLSNLRIISIPFPYAGSFGREESFCCVRSLFLAYISQQFTCFLQDDNPLRQIQFHFLRRDGLTTNHTKIKLRKDGFENQMREADREQVSNFEGSVLDFGGFLNSVTDPLALATMEDLGDKPTDPIDLSSTSELMLISTSRNQDFRWVRTQRKFFNPFLNELAGEVMGAGNKLEHWSRLEDAVSNPNINRIGVKCTDCNCIA